MRSIIRRSRRVAFMDTDKAGSTPKYERMTDFSTFSGAKNPKEYTRQYVDESSERSDVTGYSPSISYSFDRHTETPVHDRIASIHDDELLGSDACVDIVVVDLFEKSEDGQLKAKKRTYSVIPNVDGDGTDALVYSGTLRAASDFVDGTATISEDGKIATFTPKS